MNPLRSLSSRAVRGIKLLGAFLILALSLTPFIPRDAEAVPACGVHRYYYRDQTYTVQVGHSLHTCSGTFVSQSGTTSPYIITRTYCCLN